MQHHSLGGAASSTGEEIANGITMQCLAMYKLGSSMTGIRTLLGYLPTALEV